MNLNLFRKTTKDINIVSHQGMQDLEKDFLEKYDRCRDFTMTSVERMYANYTAVNYINKYKIEGSIVECGVWKGGSTIMMLETLLGLGESRREIFMYDTFEGMPEPEEVDEKFSGTKAKDKWMSLQRDGYNEWDYSSFDEVTKNISKVKYPKERIKMIKGMVEETIPGVIPDKIAILRLDTDWYSSTNHELEHLYPRLQIGGVLIIDDYGTWKGAQKAVNEYFESTERQIMLSRIDPTGRVGIKIK